jgi:pimeloyl-ACP methyl ester carboxylesterase
LSYDRLGIGQSYIGEPVNEIQSALEIAALKALTDAVRAGEVCNVPAFQRILHAGHSFGSVQTYALTAMYPNVSDGIILQGFSQNGTFLPFFQLGGNFVQANLNEALAKYPDGYLAAGNPSAVQTNFFAPGVFDPELLPVAFMTGQPVTVGELLTIGGATAGVNNFAGPVLVITGERDVPFCGGDCFKAPTGFASIPETSKANFPSASVFNVSIVATAGHGLNLEYTAPQTYATMLDFFARNGLAPSARSA